MGNIKNKLLKMLFTSIRTTRTYRFKLYYNKNIKYDLNKRSFHTIQRYICHNWICSVSSQNLLKRPLNALKNELFPVKMSSQTSTGSPSIHPENGRLVYEGKITTMVKFAKAFSVSTSILGICAQPILINKAAESTLPVALKIMMGSFFNFFVFLTPLLLHFLTKRYVSLLYFNDETKKFTATTYSFFVYPKTTQFCREEAEIPELPPMLHTFSVAGKPMFVDSEQFIDPEAFIHLMGYDKPINWDFPDDVKMGVDERKQK